MKVLDGLEDFLNDSRKKLSENTLQGYQIDIKQFSEFYTGDLNALKTKDIERYQKYLEKTYKPKTTNRKLFSLKKYLMHLNKKAYIENTAYLEIEAVKIQDEGFLDENRVVNNNECKRLINKAKEHQDKRAVAIMTTLAFTGLRVSELLSLECFDYRTGEIIITGKGAKKRVVFIADEVIQAIDEYVAERGHKKGDYIFINQRNKNQMPRQRINEIISHYGGQAKILKSKTHPHAFRHMVGVTLIKKMPIEEVRAMLGHSNITTTQIYTKPSGTELKRKSQSALREALL